MVDVDGFTIKRREMPQDNPGSIPGFALGHNLPFALYLKDSVANAIRAYVNADPCIEVGGALFGRHYQSDDRQQTVVEVNECLPLPSINRGRAHYTFDAAAIRTLRNSKQTSTRYLVGWFHSHPGFGDPFMSIDDLELHKRNFPEPWYLSCVVGGGQYSLPLGFFRMEGGQLVSVDEYFLAMTLEPVLNKGSNTNLITAVGEASRRFARALVGEERPVQASIGLARRVLADLGIQLSSSLNNYFESAIERDAALPHYSRTLGAFFSLIELAAVARQDSTVDAELSRIEECLRVVHLFADSMLLVFATDEPGDVLAVWGSRCLFAIRGGACVIVGDFELNIFQRLELTSEDAIQDVGFSEDALGWILLRSGLLLRVNLTYLETAHKRDNRTRVFLPENDAGFWEQIEAHKTRLFVRDATRIRESAKVSESSEEYVTANELAVPAAITFLIIDHRDGQPGLVYQADGRVFLRFPHDASVDVELDVPTWAQGATLKGAAFSNVGIALLIERETATMLLTLATTGQLRSVIIHEPDEQIRINGVTSDEEGRLFILTETNVWLLMESGAPNDTWSASKRSKQNKLWLNSLLDPSTFPGLSEKR
jgi:proteasome lid subunit RPN8/RPN11